MRKLFNLLCGMLVASSLATVSAETPIMKIWKNGQVVAWHDNESLDSITFDLNKKESLGDYEYMINGYKFIDLGLPSGLLWAEKNVGAEKSTDSGNYYAWDETAVKTEYSWANYTYCYTHYDADPIKYNTDDEKTVLENVDDAAYANCGPYCSTPSPTNFEELFNSEYCTVTSTTKDNVDGYEIVSKTNGKSIFLPKAGYWYGDRRYSNAGMYYWTNTRDSSTDDSGSVKVKYAICFNPTADLTDLTYSELRDYGMLIRPVATKE